MFWMMNDMGPHGRGMRQGGTCRTGGRGGRGGLSVFPGALIGIFGALIALNVAGTVIAAVFAGLAAALFGVMSAVGSVLYGLVRGAGHVVSGLVGSLGHLFTSPITVGSVAAGVIVGVLLYIRLRRRNAGSRDNGNG